MNMAGESGAYLAGLLFGNCFGYSLILYGTYRFGRRKNKPWWQKILFILTCLISIWAAFNLVVHLFLLVLFLF